MTIRMILLFTMICALSITPYQATCQKLALFADPGKCGMLVGRGALDIPARES